MPKQQSSSDNSTDSNSALNVYKYDSAKVKTTESNSVAG